MTERRRRHRRGAHGADDRRHDRRDHGRSLDDCVAEIDAIAAAAAAERADVIVLCHGGPIAMPEDAAYVLRHAAACHGFYGASSMERLPVEAALTEQTRAFKAIGRKP